MIVVAALIVILLLLNLLTNKWAKDHYLLTCIVATAALIAIARWDGVSWDALGLAPGTWKQGLYWSIGVFAAVAVFYAIAASIPAARRGFNDKRAAEQGWLSVLYHSTIRIPFGTAVFEEVAFRGVLLAVVANGWGWWQGVIVSSVAFGLWHILPSLDFADANAAAGMLGTGRRAQINSVILTVLGTGAAGVGFCVLRGLSESLFPPIVLHAALNGIGLAVSWAFARRVLRDL